MDKTITLNKQETHVKQETPVKLCVSDWFLQRVHKNNKYTDPETRFKSKKCRYY